MIDAPEKVNKPGCLIGGASPAVYAGPRAAGFSDTRGDDKAVLTTGAIPPCPRCGNRRYVLESCREFVVLRCRVNAHDERLEFVVPKPPYRAPGTRPYYVVAGCTTRPMGTRERCARHRGAA